MRFDDVKHRGVHCKELGPNVGVSMAPTATYDELVEEGIKYFFSYKENAAGVASREYFLADRQGSKLPNTLQGRPWVLADYLHMHGMFPSKTRIFCVQVSSLVYMLNVGYLIMCIGNVYSKRSSVFPVSQLMFILQYQSKVLLMLLPQYHLTQMMRWL